MTSDDKVIPPSLLSFVSQDIMKVVSELNSDNEKSLDRALLALHSVYGNIFERALDLLEKNCVMFLSDPEGIRTIIQVIGSGGSLYTILPEVNYCPCPAFQYQVVGAKADLTCKHVLAAQISSIMGKCKKRVLSSSELSEILLRSFGVYSTLHSS